MKWRLPSSDLSLHVYPAQPWYRLAALSVSRDISRVGGLQHCISVSRSVKARPERMEELPGIIIAIVVIFFIARYFSGELPLLSRSARSGGSTFVAQGQNKRVALFPSVLMVYLPMGLSEVYRPQW